MNEPSNGRRTARRQWSMMSSNREYALVFSEDAETPAIGRSREGLPGRFKGYSSSEEAAIETRK